MTIVEHWRPLHTLSSEFSFEIILVRFFLCVIMGLLWPEENVRFEIRDIFYE